MKYSVVAQHRDDAGACFFTSNLPWEKMVLALLNEPNVSLGLDGDSLRLSYTSGTDVFIGRYLGAEQVEPVVLFDGGHKLVDMNALKHIFDIFSRPYVRCGSLEARFLDRKDYRELCKRFNLDESVIRSRALIAQKKSFSFL